MTILENVPTFAEIPQRKSIHASRALIRESAPPGPIQLLEIATDRSKPRTLEKKETALGKIETTIDQLRPALEKKRVAHGLNPISQGQNHISLALNHVSHGQNPISQGPNHISFAFQHASHGEDAANLEMMADAQDCPRASVASTGSKAKTRWGKQRPCSWVR